MTRTAIGRWLRASAAVAAAAALHSTAPAAQAAATPCSDPAGVVAQGYVGTQYLQVRYDRVSTTSGVKVCFQVGDVSTAVTGGDTYGVIDIPVPSATVARPETDTKHERCKEHPYNQNVFTGRVPAAGSVRIDYFNGPTWDAVCWEVFDSSGAIVTGGRLIVHGTPATVSGTPQVGLVEPAPPQSLSHLGGYPADQPSSHCSTDPGRWEFIDLYSMGTQYRLHASTIAVLGTTSVCVRRQDAATGKGVGGRLTINTTAIPTVAHSRDGAACTVEHASFSVLEGAAYLWIGSSPVGATGTQSICVRDSPTSTNRIDVTPSAGVVQFTPDSDTP